MQRKSELYGYLQVPGLSRLRNILVLGVLRPNISWNTAYLLSLLAALNWWETSP